MLLGRALTKHAVRKAAVNTALNPQKPWWDTSALDKARRGVEDTIDKFEEREDYTYQPWEDLPDLEGANRMELLTPDVLRKVSRFTLQRQHWYQRLPTDYQRHVEKSLVKRLVAKPPRSMLQWAASGEGDWRSLSNKLYAHTKHWRSKDPFVKEVRRYTRKKFRRIG